MTRMRSSACPNWPNPSFTPYPSPSWSGDRGLDFETLWYVGVGALLSIANYLCLTAGYKRLDLTVAYPVSRSSTIFLPFLALLFLGERIDVAGWASVLLVSLGVLVIQLRSFRLSGMVRTRPGLSAGLAFSIMAAFTVALYTLWGKVAVAHIHPFVYMYCYTLASNLWFAPSLLRLDRDAVRTEWRLNKWRILGVAVLNTLSFVLILFALETTKASYVGALRQLSLVVGAILGRAALGEPFPRPRAVGTALIIFGACLTYLAR